MYLHLGQGVVVPEADVIGVFDLDNTTSSHITRKFLSDAERAGKVISVSGELPNSFVVCSEGRLTRRVPPPKPSPSKLVPSAVSAENPAKGGFGPAVKGDGGSGMRIYLSQLSSQTLYKRSGTMRFE